MNVKLSNSGKIKLTSSIDIYGVMERIFKRESKTDRKKEHFWVISLDTVCRILNIELVSLGTVNSTLVEPMEVYSIPLQKKAVRIILVHNHPSGELKASEADKDLTNRLIQCGHILKTPVSDHIIINESSYFSFYDNGLMDELIDNTRYVPAYILAERLKADIEKKMEEKLKKEIAKEMAKSLKEKGVDIDIIVSATGLTKSLIARLK